MNDKRTLLTVIMGVLIASNSFPQWETFRQSFHLLTTIAGKGEADNDNANVWLPAYEGGPAAAAALSSPHMAMADSAGNVYIADKDAHAIRKVDTKGVITTVAGTSVAGNGGDGRATQQALYAPNGVWVNKKGEFYILDLNNATIRKVDADGAMTALVIDTTGISLGRGLWVSKAEDTIWYASGSRIKMWTKEAGIVIYASGFSALGNIVQDRNGYIVATDRSANMVYRIDNQGAKTAIAGNDSTSGGGDGFPALQTAFYGVRGVWFLEDNTYFLATHEGSQVWYIDGEGTAHLFLNGLDGDAYHSGDGENYQTAGFKISEARAVTVDYQGNVLVTENDRGFVRKVEKANVSVFIKNLVRAAASPRIYSDPSTGTIRVQLTHPAPGNVGVHIRNLLGRRADVRAMNEVSPCTHEFQWQSRKLPDGVYCITVQSGNIFFTRRCMLLH